MEKRVGGRKGKRENKGIIFIFILNNKIQNKKFKNPPLILTFPPLHSDVF